jgi:hypothetical protein
MTVGHAAAAAAIIVACGTPAAAQAAVDTLTAIASAKSGGSAATAPVTIAVVRYATDSDRAQVAAALKERGMAGVTAFLAGQADVGYIEIGGHRQPIRYASQMTTASGRLVTVVTAKPLLFVGASLPSAPPREGFDLGIALLDLNAAGAGTGELAPAAKVSMDAGGALVISDYGSTVVWLSGLARAK